MIKYDMFKIFLSEFSIYSYILDRNTHLPKNEWSKAVFLKLIRIKNFKAKLYFNKWMET